MEVKTEPLKEILGELFALLEAQETHSVAVLQFLRDQGIAADEKLAPYLEQAGRASNVKWLAARRRMEHLLTPIQKETTDGNKDKEKGQETSQEKGKQQKDKVADKAQAEPAQALAQGPAPQKSASEAKTLRSVPTKTRTLTPKSLQSPEPRRPSRRIQTQECRPA
jgi:hypothetical protein